MEFATSANLSVSTRATQWVTSRFITASCRGTFEDVGRRRLFIRQGRRRLVAVHLEFPVSSRFDQVGLHYCRNRPQEPLIFVFITSRCDVISWGREDGITSSSYPTDAVAAAAMVAVNPPFWIEPSGFAHQFSSSLPLQSFCRFLFTIILLPSISLFAGRKTLSSALYAASKIRPDTDCLWLQTLRECRVQKKVDVAEWKTPGWLPPDEKMYREE